MDIRELQPLLRAKGVNVTDDDPVFLHLLLNQVVLDDAAVGSQSGMRRLNIDKLQGVLLHHGIRIRNDDPVFTLLALNEIAIDRMLDNQRKTLARDTAQRRLSMSLLLLTAGCGVAAGIFLGRGGSHLVAGVSGLALGAILCGIATWLWPMTIKNGQSNSVGLIQKVESVNPFVWTEIEFNRVAENMTKPLSLRTKAACFDVLICGVDIDTATATHNLREGQLARGLIYFNDCMHKM